MEKEIIELTALTKLNFTPAEKIGDLKISLGPVTFDEKGGSSKITKPDLRYFWDGEVFGLHVSDCDYTNKDLIELIKACSNDIIANLQVLYIGITQIESLDLGDLVFPKLLYLNLSQNPKLKKVSIGKTPVLKEIYASDCPVLEVLSFNSSKLEKVDIARSKVQELPKDGFENLAYLNIQGNNIGTLYLINMPSLKYLFAKNNTNIEIGWPIQRESNKEISILNIDKSNATIPIDIIEIAENYSDHNLREKIRLFFNLAAALGETPEVAFESINRLQIMLVGNTTAGKSELKNRFLGNKTPVSNSSTHGVQHFNKILDSGIEVIGFDFGGQDYYHALHLPFFDERTHFLLIWGNHFVPDLAWGEFQSEGFYGKYENIEDRENPLINLLFPLEYWIKSIDYTIRKKDSDSDKILNKGPKANHLGEDIIEKKDGHLLEKNEHTIKIDLIQNVRADTQEFFLNIKDLKNRKDVSIEEIVGYDFAKKPVRVWLEKRLAALQKEKNEILSSVKNFGQILQIDTKVVLLSAIELHKKIEKEVEIEGENINTFIASLVTNRYLFYPGKFNERLKDIYIVNIEKFTQYIYQILSKDLATSEKEKGYFLKEQAFESIKGDKGKDIISDEIKEFILNFLIESDVIFKVEGSEKENPKYVAPTYLSSPVEKVEKLFIDSFEKPDCAFEFQDFFHPNLMLQIIKTYKGQMVKDEERIEYLIWKNCVIIYNTDKTEADLKGDGPKPKDFLKLELLMPTKDDQKRIPTFTIARNNAGYVQNDQFHQVFTTIKELLDAYKPKIKVKNPYGEKCLDYVDIEKSIKEGENKTHYVYSDGILYPKYDFRHFLGDKIDAPLKVFIAYSKHDDMYRLELKDHLLGINNREIIVFDDREMEIGEKWDARLKKELEQCDIFVVLISVKTLGTSYIINTEIPAALKRFEKGELRIIPIIISPCSWEKTGLASLNANDKALPITHYDIYDLSKELGPNGRAAKWNEIVKEIENIESNKENEHRNESNSTSPSDEPASGDHQ